MEIKVSSRHRRFGLPLDLFRHAWTCLDSSQTSSICLVTSRLHPISVLVPSQLSFNSVSIPFLLRLCSVLASFLLCPSSISAWSQLRLSSISLKYPLHPVSVAFNSIQLSVRSIILNLVYFPCYLNDTLYIFHFNI